MATATIGANSYEVYNDVATVDIYLEADSNSAAYRALDADGKARLDVTATRIFERLLWAGEKTDDDQILSWPRSGIDIVDDEDEIAQDVLDAHCELVNQLANGVDVANQQNGSQKEQSIKAGSVAVTYFRGAEGDSLRLPLPVWEMIRKYFGSAGTLVLGSVSYGTGACDPLAVGYGFNEGI